LLGRPLQSTLKNIGSGMREADGGISTMNITVYRVSYISCGWYTNDIPIQYYNTFYRR